MSPATVHTDAFLRSWRELEEGIVTAARQAFADAVGEASNNARTTTTWRDRTGCLRRNITVRERGPFRASLAANAKYALFLEEGTRPHEIHAKNAPYLVFRTFDGVLHRRKFVRHPGTKATHFMANAAKVGERQLLDGTEDRVDRAIHNDREAHRR